MVREKAPDALARLSELLAAKVGKPVTPPLCDYLDTVGNTPLVKLGKCLPEGVKAARVLAKLEMCNPGGSLKDRIALQMIEKAEKDGLITPGKTTLVDFTSGNTGIGEAMVCAAKGYKCIIVMPQVRSPRLTAPGLHPHLPHHTLTTTSPSSTLTTTPTPRHLRHLDHSTAPAGACQFRALYHLPSVRS